MKRRKGAASHEAAHEATHEATRTGKKGENVCILLKKGEHFRGKKPRLSSKKTVKIGRDR